ncbi:hypothetical protein [Variovorax paradoxus]
MPMHLTVLSVPTLVDGLVLLMACKTAAFLVLELPLGPSPGFEVGAWFGLAVFYAGCVWVCGAERRTSGAPEVFARACLLFGALLSGCLAHQFGELAQPSPVQLLDWLVLGVCFGCSAILERLSSNK